MSDTSSDAPQGDPTPTTPTPTPPPDPTPQPVPDKEPAGDDTAKLKMELEKWRAMARQHESENKKAGKELEELRRKSMSEQEKAVLDAKASGRSEVLVEMGAKLVDAEIRAVAAGRLDPGQLAVLFQGLNRSVFLLEDGSVDEKSVHAFIDGLAPKPQEPEPPKSPQFPDLGQGVRGASPVALNGDPLLAALKRAVGAQ